MELTQKQLDELKIVELELLRAYVDVCRQLGLRYYVMGGTMLGAVRHQGYIPWDDDIDVGMPREDYEVFLEQGQALLPEGMFLQTHDTDPAFPANFAKIRNSGTTFVEASMRDCPMNHGVYIDVFPLDACSGRSSRWFAMKKLLLGLRISDAFTVSGMKPATKLLRCLTRGISIDAALRRREKLFRSGSGDYLANHCGAWGEKEIVPAHWYGEGVDMPFEGIAVKVPTCYDQWLTQVYGEYMQLPPEDKRIPHHYVSAFDLHKPYND